MVSPLGDGLVDTGQGAGLPGMPGIVNIIESLFQCIDSIRCGIGINTVED